MILTLKKIIINVFKKTSIVLCTYNEGKYIEESIKKLKNHIKNLELIIVDDNSKDETRNIIEKINSNNEIKLIHRTKTKGLASAFLTDLWNGSQFDYISFECQRILFLLLQIPF